MLHYYICIFIFSVSNFSFLHSLVHQVYSIFRHFYFFVTIPVHYIFWIVSYHLGNLHIYYLCFLIIFVSLSSVYSIVSLCIIHISLIFFCIPILHASIFFKGFCSTYNSAHIHSYFQVT